MTDAIVDERTIVELTADELDLVRTALRLLRSTLGRDEASELEEVRMLLERFETLARSHAGR